MILKSPMGMGLLPIFSGIVIVADGASTNLGGSFTSVTLIVTSILWVPPLLRMDHQRTLADHSHL